MSDVSNFSLSAETSKATIAKFGMAAIGFIGTVIFARILGNEALGSYFLVFAAAELAVRPIAGIGEAIQKRAAEVNTPSGETFGVQILFTSIWLLIILIAAFLLAGWLNTYFSLQNGVLLFTLLVVGEGAYMASIPMIQARGRIGLSIGIDTFRSYATFALQVTLLILGYGVGSLVYGLVGASLLSVPLALRYHVVKPSIPSQEVLSHIWEFSKYSTINTLIAKTYERFDELLLGLLLTSAAVGDYGIAARLTLPALFVSSVAAQGLIVRVSTLESKSESSAEDVSNTLAFASILAIPLFFGSLVTATDIATTVYGPEFTGSAVLIVGLAFARLIGSQMTPLGRTLDGLDQPRTNTIISTVALLLNVLLGVVLTLQFGAVGVVAATVTAGAIKYVLTAYAVRKEIPEVSLFSRPLVEQIIAGAIMLVIVFIFKQFVDTQSFFGLGIILTIGCLTYVAILSTISEQFRTTVLSAIENI